MSDSPNLKVSREITDFATSNPPKDFLESKIATALDQAQATGRREGITEMVKLAESLDPLEAPGRWEDGSYEEIAEDIQTYLVKQLQAKLKESSPDGK